MVPAEVQAAVGGDLAYTTVMTILVRLHDKGVIERSKVGRAYAYRPVVTEETVVADQVRRLLAPGQDPAPRLPGLVGRGRPPHEQGRRSPLPRARPRGGPGPRPRPGAPRP